MCAVCGVLVMALPIPIVVDNFADYYQEQKKLEAKELKAEANAVEEVLREAGHCAAMAGLVDTVSQTTQPAPAPAPVTRPRPRNGDLQRPYRPIQ